MVLAWIVNSIFLFVGGFAVYTLISLYLDHKKFVRYQQYLDEVDAKVKIASSADDGELLKALISQLLMTTPEYFRKNGKPFPLSYEVIH